MVISMFKTLKSFIMGERAVQTCAIQLFGL